MERRLAAILAADAVGYSRLVEADEAGTLAAFKAHLDELIFPAIAEHHGRVVKTTGDGFLAEFGSIVDAVRCAIAVQHGMVERNLAVAADKRLQFRIGVNLGDVAIEGGDIYGDGVNIAARLEQNAPPGGILLSGAAYDQLQGKLDVALEPAGEQHVKNIARPIRIYRVRLDSGPASKPAWGARRPGLVRTVGALVILLVLGIGGWAAYDKWTATPRVASPASLPPLPDKPSVAVLPFSNMSGDAQQEYFADGMTDDLITDLSQVAGLFVIARNSSFAYKGKTVDIRQVARELGVRYVLEGSVQRAGEQVRINAQLIDATTGGHKWADRYDGSFAEVFALQDRVTRSIADALALRLTAAEQQSLVRQETSVPDAYDAFLKGWVLYRRADPADFAKAIPHFEDAIRLDPNYGRAYAALAMIYVQSVGLAYWQNGLGIPYTETRYRAEQNLKKAKERPTSTGYQAAALFALFDRGDREGAVAGLKDAIALEPGDSWSYAYMGWVLSWAGRPSEALPFIDTATRLDPLSPPVFFYYRGFAQFDLARFADAAVSLETAVRLNPDDPWPFVHLASAYGHLGRTEEAKSAVARFDALSKALGGTRLTLFMTSTTFWFPADRTPVELLMDGLRKAGLSE